MTDGDGSTCSCKVGRVLSAYDCESFDRRLLEGWQATDGPSLRELADECNRELVEAALARDGGAVLEGEAANFYRLLTDDDVTAGTRTAARNRLAERSVDPDRLAADFVSHQTIYRHLTRCHDASAPVSDPTPTERVADASDTIRALRNRTRAVTVQTLTGLAESGAIDAGELEVYVDVGVACTDCHRQTDVDSLLEAGGCDCETD